MFSSFRYFDTALTRSRRGHSLTEANRLRAVRSGCPKAAMGGCARYLARLACGVVLLVGIWGLGSRATAQPPSVPDDGARLKKAFFDYFGGLGDWAAGDLITRDQAQGAVKLLGDLGWKTAGADEILSRVPTANEWLVGVLRTEDGRRFMRQISRFPGAYDRLERLSRLPHGKQTILDLVRGPDGYKMIEYLTITSGGKSMGRMLSQASGGSGFNQPTGRIYTAEALWNQLRRAAPTGP